MIKIYSVFPVLRDLIQLKEDSPLTSGMIDRIQILEQELEFLVLYKFCLTGLDHSTFGEKKASGFAEISRIDATLEKKGLLQTGVFALDSGEFEDWDTLSSELLEEIQLYKATIREDCFNFSDCAFRCYFSDDQLQKLMRYLSVSLANVFLLKGDMVPDAKMKIESLKEKQHLFKKVFKFTTKRYSSSEMLEFKIWIKAWAWNAACLCLLNWVLDEKDKNMAPKMNVILKDLQWKLNFALPEITRMCLALLKASKASADERFKVMELVSRFVKFLLGNFRVDLPKDDIEMLRNGMILLITYLIEPPEANEYANDGQLNLTQAAAAVDDAASLIISLSSSEMKEAGIAEARNFLLHDFLGKVEAIKAEVRKIYPHLFLDSSYFNCPRINILCLYDSLIENLKEISIRFPKYQILTVQEELVLLRGLLTASNLKDCFISELQNEHKELKDLWTRIVNVAYLAERIIKSFIYSKSFRLLEMMLCLLNVTEEIKHIKAEVKRIQDQHMHEIDALFTEKNLSPAVPLQTNFRTMDEVVVGFEDEIKDILDRLKGGSTKLDIISIIGMAGMGKTTLAKKVYKCLSIENHFTKCAWCTVSQSYNGKNLLLDILRCVTMENDGFFEKEEEELADILRKCLKGQKYLIVMDDIWDVSAWNAVKWSFPDDNNASRIIFTSRIYKVVLEAKSDSRPYPLRPLSEKESWELLEERLFHKDRCPPNFIEVGKQMAKDCKGLPLAVVLVAGLLKEKIKDLNWWKKIGENLGPRISEGGCADILELSYKHLPEYLKACFLYFGSFHEDKVIGVQKLTQLWVSEGFIQKQEMKSLEIVAKEYLMDLVGRNLVIVTNRSSSGGIKACQLHDLLREFCLAKGEEENFFKLVQGNDVSQFSRDGMGKHFRVCIQTQHWRSFLSWNSSALHSLLFSPTDTSKPFDMDHCSFRNSKYLQVLDLEDVKLQGHFPEEVTALFFLRYLAIWCNTTFIPLTITRLENLETLHVRRTEVKILLPPGLLRMEKLRHVDVGKIFPSGLVANIPPLENVQSFSFPCLGYGYEAERFLRKIPKIRKLRCHFGTLFCGKDGRELKLNFLNHLESLNATHGERKLRSCAFSLPSTLKKLTLKKFGLPWTEISTIAKLPNLEVLELLDEAFNGKAWNMENEKFSKLKFLKLQKLQIEQWSASEEHFPSLVQIVVEQCRRLEEIPVTFGNISTLSMIQVGRCRSTVASSAMEIQKEQIDLGNEDFKVLTKLIFE